MSSLIPGFTSDSYSDQSDTKYTFVEHFSGWSVYNHSVEVNPGTRLSNPMTHHTGFPIYRSRLRPTYASHYMREADSTDGITVWQPAHIGPEHISDEKTNLQQIVALRPEPVTARVLSLQSILLHSWGIVRRSKHICG